LDSGVAGATRARRLGNLTAKNASWSVPRVCRKILEKTFIHFILSVPVRMITQVVLRCPAEETSTPFKRAYAIINPEGYSYKFYAPIRWYIRVHWYPLRWVSVQEMVPRDCASVVAYHKASLLLRANWYNISQRGG
jgi:hypothetical protein